MISTYHTDGKGEAKMSDKEKVLLAALKAVEYIDLADFFIRSELVTEHVMDTPICPYCVHKKGDGHSMRCVIGLALDG